jgi:lipoyl-dependent peroxiredoxin subunit D
MAKLEELRAALPDFAKDLRLNLDAVLGENSLSKEQRWGIALASALATRRADLIEALTEAALEQAGEAVIDDARAAAALMGMNNVYYRFRHLVGKPSYQEKPARLRMTRIAKPATTKADFELFCLAVSAINGCETCMRSHEQVVTGAGLSEEQVHDAVRVAAAISGVATALAA